MKLVLAIIFAAAVIGRLSTLIVPVGASVQAAQPAPPTVTACDLVNTATLSGGGMIEVFRCTPDGGAPYLLDSFGFMKDVE